MAEKSQELPPGYVVPVHRSLTEELYWGGVPRNILIFEIFGGILGGVFFKTFSIVVLMFLVHMVCCYFGQKDPKFLQVYWSNKDYKPFYKA